MKISSFFKILNRKINKYDKLATNPFEIPQNITVIWVENATPNPQQNLNSDNNS